MKIDFNKNDGLVPAIIQDAQTGKVLMLGYMNEESLQKTRDSKQVTFYSRSRKELWTKGETSGNYLNLVDIHVDCDNDTLLVKAIPDGPTCHTGVDTCFNEQNKSADFLLYLEQVIQSRKNSPEEKSYTAKLYKKGIAAIAQKVGEEAVETVIEAVSGNKERFKEETADLLYHLLVLMSAQDLTLDDTLEVLRQRHK